MKFETRFWQNITLLIAILISTVFLYETMYVLVCTTISWYCLSAPFTNHEQCSQTMFIGWRYTVLPHILHHEMWNMGDPSALQQIHHMILQMSPIDDYILCIQAMIGDDKHTERTSAYSSIVYHLMIGPICTDWKYNIIEWRRHIIQQ